jgi:putative oxidoreductase
MTTTTMARTFRLSALLDMAQTCIPLSAIQLAARLGIAGTFFKSGLTKIDSDWQVTDLAITLFREEYRVPLLPPELAANLGAFTELSMPILLAAGFLSRLAALPLLGMTLVIQLFVYPSAWDTHAMWAALLLLIIARGPGVVSIDALLGLERRTATDLSGANAR